MRRQAMSIIKIRDGKIIVSWSNDVTVKKVKKNNQFSSKESDFRNVRDSWFNKVAWNIKRLISKFINGKTTYFDSGMQMSLKHGNFSKGQINDLDAYISEVIRNGSKGFPRHMLDQK